MRFLRNTPWVFFPALLIVYLGLSAVPARGAGAQEPQSYTEEEYKAFQAASGETDAAKKTALIMQFLKERPKSSLRPNVLGLYQQLMSGLQTGKRWPALISAGTQFLEFEPEDMFTHSLLTTAYQETKNHKEFVDHAEKVFAKNPNGTLAYYLAKAYLELKNDAKYLQWGEKAVEFMPDNHETLLELSKRFAALNRRPQAMKYARQCLKALQAAQKPEGTDDKVWREYVNNGLANCFGIVGNIAYEQRDYATAISNLESSLKHYKRNDLAYYYLGLSLWQQNRMDVAMLNLAKAYLLGGSSSRSAKQHLDNLYKSTHGQSLVGQERVIARAKEDLAK